LITQKYNDFIIFKNIINLINKGKKYLTKEDFISIINMKASMNKGLSLKLKKYFPNTNPVEKVKINLPVSINSN
jgi:hypothetical protein